MQNMRSNANNNHNNNADGWLNYAMSAPGL